MQTKPEPLPLKLAEFNHTISRTDIRRDQIIPLLQTFYDIDAPTFRSRGGIDAMVHIAPNQGDLNLKHISLYTRGDKLGYI